jgi:DNA-binding FadR family transcriptional regulator
MTEWNLFSPLVIRWRLEGPERMRQLHELSQLRSVVEPLAARLAARAASDAQRGAISDAVHGMVRHSHEATSAPYLEADIAFHSTVLEASGNPMLAALCGVIAAVLAGRTEHALMPQDANLEALRLHQAVAFAIGRGDADGAAAAMADIVVEADAAMQRLAG